MNFKINSLCVMIWASFIAMTSTCDVTSGQGNCNYTIACDTYPYSVTLSSCHEPADGHITFIITNTYSNDFSVSFFSETNFDLLVREIRAYNNNWINIAPFTFQYYPRTIILDISNNNIVNIGDLAFGELGYLITLNVSNNEIENLHPESLFITPESYECNLKELDLSNNKLTKLYREFNVVSNLEKLHLQNNMLSTIDDDAFKVLSNLEYLNLQNNYLVYLNSTLRWLVRLKTLDISYNNLLTLAGPEINSMTNIVYFNASHNPLTTVDSNCFNQADSLETVDFSYCSINATIENLRFVGNNHLKYLNFYNNRISGIEENAFLHNKIDYINFENNNITGDIKEYTFNGLKNVTKLDLSRQSISGLKNKSFTSMISLTHLNLSVNYIREIENATFYNTSIAILDLSHNNITNLNYLKNCLPKLTELYLNDNEITIVPNNSFGYQPLIRKLDLSRNNIKIIEQYSLPLQNLKYFFIVGNYLQGVIKKNVFSPAKYLRFLDLSNFNITKIDDSAFVELPVLARLNLSNNGIESIESNNFKGVEEINSLDLSHNKLTHVAFNNSILTNNLDLHLQNNRLTNVSGLCTKKCKFVYLDLSDNNISDLTMIDVDMFPNLMALHLANNKIKNFNNPGTNSMSTLFELKLSSNEMSNINLSYFKELISVDLSNNNLTVLNSTVFKYIEYLHSLDVSRNNVTDLQPGTFKFLKYLMFLNLSSNYLTRLRFGSLQNLYILEILDLSKNHIEVLDVDVFHDCNELKTLIIDYNNIKTLDFQKLILVESRLTKLSLGGNPISCEDIVHLMKLKDSIRKVEVTSVDKTYNEENVFGIKCGDRAFRNVIIEKTFRKGHKEKTTSELSATGTVLTLCSILTVLFIGTGVLAYIKLYKKNVLVVDSNVTMRYTLNLDESDFENHLLF